MSVAAQTYPDLELLIADDGSTDRTREAVEAFLGANSGRFARVVFLSRENHGIAATLNELLEHARGRFLFLIASDDRAKPHAVATLYAFLASHPRHALAVGDNEIIDATGMRVAWDAERHTVTDPAEAVYRTWGEYLRAIRRPKDFTRRGFGHVEALEIDNYVPNGKMFRRSAVVQVGGWRPGTLEDWDLNFRLARRYRLAYLDQVLFSYRWHAANTMKNPTYFCAAHARTRDLIEEQRRGPLLRIRIRLNRRPLRWAVGRLGLRPRVW